MYRMRIIQSKLGDIHHVLEDIHKNPTAATSLCKKLSSYIGRQNNDIMVSSVNNIEELLSLEAQYGPLTGYTPAINEILNYLQQVSIILMVSQAVF